MPIPPIQVKNESDEYLGLDRDGNVVTGEANPEMVTLLAVPGGTIGQDVVDKHDLGDRIKGTPKAAEPDPRLLESVKVRKPLLTEDEARTEAIREKPPEPAVNLGGSDPLEIAGEAKDAAESGTRPFGGKGTGGRSGKV